MRKLTVLLAAAGLLLGLTGSAQAGDLDQPTTTLSLILSALPKVTATALPGTESMVALGDGSFSGPSVGHNILVSSTVWSTVNLGPGTSLFTGVPIISNLKITMVNQAAALADGFVTPTNPLGGGVAMGSTFGGVMRLSGQAVVSALGGIIQLPVPLGQAGGVFGETTMVTLLGSNITVENGPWVTDPVVFTGISSNIITIPARGNVQGVAFTLQPTPGETAMTPSTNGGYVSISGGNAFEDNQVTASGTQNLLSGSKAGTVTAIAPMRVATGNIAGNIPGRLEAHFEFVPEPGTMLLLVSGAVGLAVIGRRRMRK
jgi:hypothetical protein